MLANNFIVSLFKSFGLHLFIGVGLVASVTLSPDEKPKPVAPAVQPVKAVSVDTNKLTEQVNKIRATKAKKQAAERKRVEDLEARANRAANKRKNQETKIKDLNKKTRQSQAEKRRADAAAAKAKAKQKRETQLANKAADETKKQLRQKAAADKAAADAKKRKIDAEKAEKKAEADRQAKAKKLKEDKARKAREARLRREQELMLQQQMAQEQAARDKAHNQQVLGEVEKFKALIMQRIKQGMRRDETMRGKSCRVNVKLAFNGLVTRVKVLGGDPQVCDAAKASIYKLDKVPMSKDRAVFDELKDINLTFEPEV
ncbi:MAG: cell envelope integrity protein TolA [Algicola sp.]|nr:cell envelope integrity protein TolA [Algicola sp.]